MSDDFFDPMSGLPLTAKWFERVRRPHDVQRETGQLLASAVDLQGALDRLVAQLDKLGGSDG